MSCSQTTVYLLQKVQSGPKQVETYKQVLILIHCLELSWLDDIFVELIGEYYKHLSGNFYITTQLHDAHVDLLTEDETNRFEWASNVIPPQKLCDSINNY